MNTYRIKRMTLQNFCGIKHLEIAPNGADAAVYGDNATGKTTIANAFTWLFTGKNSLGTAELDPAPLDENNGKIHNLETSVTVEFTDGADFRRTLSEVWSKKRGSVTEELTGTKTAYYINSVPCKEKEFTAAIEERFGDAEQFRTLSISGYFSSAMDWKSRRKLLVDMSGNISDDDVISSAPELSELPEILGAHSVEDYHKIAKSKKAEIRKELDLIPARIAEHQYAGEDTVGDMTALIPEAERLERRLAEIAESRTKAENSENPFSENVKAAEAALETARGEYLKGFGMRLSEYNNDLKLLTDRKNEIFSQRSPMLVKEVQVSKKINEMTQHREKLIIQRGKINEQQYDGGSLCPCCGQELPPEQIEKAISEFNRRKSEQLEAISAEARASCSKELIAAEQQKLTELKENIEQFNSEYDTVINEIEALGAAPNGNFEDTEEFRDLHNALISAKGSMKSAKPVELIASLDKEYDEVRSKLQDIRRQQAAHEAADARRKRVAELETQQTELAASYAAYEKGEYLCEQFIRAKVSLLDERINSRFRTLKFKLFHEQQNGGLQEICKVLIPCESGLVEYEKANNAAKINAGLEIIEVLSEHYGIQLPVFVDNAESVTALDCIKNQCVRLVVSEADKQLRTEYEA